MRGGGGAESHAIAVYGDRDAQFPAGGQGNTIAMRPQMGGYKFRTRTGRRHMTRRTSRHTSRRSRRSNGGTTLTEFAVPAALLFATRFGKKRGSKRGGSSRRRSNRRRSNRRR